MRVPVPSAGSGTLDARTTQVAPFRVVIRVRPSLPRESGCGALVSVDERSNTSESHDGTGVISVGSQTFTFDRVYGPSCSQMDLYRSVARPLVLSALDGYNATILAYGPTGTGKTFTMEGKQLNGEGRGLIPRSLEEVFMHIQQCRGPQSRFLVRASHLQIYNETLSDLLKPERHHLVIREDRRKGIFVEGLSEWLCRSPSEVHALMVKGSAARITAQTAVNDMSSRSHAVFMLIVEQSETGPEDSKAEGALRNQRVAGRGTGSSLAARSSGHVRVGRVNLVDLAGSERQGSVCVSGIRMEETNKINQSLSALGNVIAALTDRRPRGHVPYRNSKLTRLLEDSLGGNCLTTMVAMVSCTACSETLSTLKFAYRAKAVKNTPHVNEDVDQRTLLRRYEAELKNLRSELAATGEDKQRLVNAVSELEARDRALEQAKFDRKELEDRIAEMSSQFLIGGTVTASHLQNAVAEQERTRSEYAARLFEVELERAALEQGKAQIGRYEQLVRKQRDIMVSLTERLHDRDEKILALQERVDELEGRKGIGLMAETDSDGSMLPVYPRELHYGGSRFDSWDGVMHLSRTPRGDSSSVEASAPGREDHLSSLLQQVENTAVAATELSAATSIRQDVAILSALLERGTPQMWNACCVSETDIENPDHGTSTPRQGSSEASSCRRFGPTVGSLGTRTPSTPMSRCVSDSSAMPSTSTLTRHDSTSTTQSTSLADSYRESDSCGRPSLHTVEGAKGADAWCWPIRAASNTEADAPGAGIARSVADRLDVWLPPVPARAAGEVVTPRSLPSALGSAVSKNLVSDVQEDAKLCVDVLIARRKAELQRLYSQKCR